jgi:hypothetical protein
MLFIDPPPESYFETVGCAARTMGVFDVSRLIVIGDRARCRAVTSSSVRSGV